MGLLNQRSQRGVETLAITRSGPTSFTEGSKFCRGRSQRSGDKSWSAPLPVTPSAMQSAWPMRPARQLGIQLQRLPDGSLAVGELVGPLLFGIGRLTPSRCRWGGLRAGAAGVAESGLQWQRHAGVRGCALPGFLVLVVSDGNLDGHLAGLQQPVKQRATSSLAQRWVG